MDEEKNTYDVDVVVTITLQAENQNDACSKARHNCGMAEHNCAFPYHWQNIE